MAANRLHTPSYRLHKPTGQAVVTLCGRDFYLGRHGSPESHAEYNRLVGEWLANARQLPGAQSDRTVNELVPPYIRHCDAYYVKDGKTTTQVHLIRTAMRVLRESYGSTLVKDFGPVALKACRAEFVRRGFSRRECNRHTGLIKQLFKWAVENELAPPSLYHALQAVVGLRKGRCEAPDPGPVGPVPDDQVEAVLPHLTPTVREMVRVQLWSGMRPEEVTRLKAADLTMSGPTWVYRPETHKNEHHDKERVVFLGPRVQAILRRRLTTDLTAYLFRPAEAYRERAEGRFEAGGRGDGGPEPSGSREYHDRYDVAAYRRAIHRACDRAYPHPTIAPRKFGDLSGPERDEFRRLRKALRDRRCPAARRKEIRAAIADLFLPPDQRAELEAWQKAHRWSPNRLRHSAATRLRREFGIDVAAAALGHSSVRTTEVYAELDQQKAAEAMGKIG